ncbi:hypothetical protein Tco_1470678, partial [Tanacetum coccineum]
YTFVSFDSNGPSSWGIPLVNVGEISEMDPYEEVAQQGQAHPLSPAYVPNPIELDKHIPIYVPELEHLKYHAPSDDDIQVEDHPYADDASPTAEIARRMIIRIPKRIPSEEHEPEDDNDDDDTDDDEEEEEEVHLALANSFVVPIVDPVPLVVDIEAFETDESAPTPRSPQTRVPFPQTRLHRARKTVRLEPPMPASMEACIAEHAAAPIPSTNLTYDQAPFGHRTSMIRMRDGILEEDMPPRRRFVLLLPYLRQGLIRSPGHNVWTIARATDRAEDVGYVRALQASKHRMRNSIKKVNLRVSYQAQVHKKESEDFYTQFLDARTNRRDIRLEIDVVRGQRTAYETELHESIKFYRIMHVTRQGADDAMTLESIQAMIDRAIQRNSTHTQDDTSQSSGGGLRRPVQPARVCSHTDFMK